MNRRLASRMRRLRGGMLLAVLGALALPALAGANHSRVDLLSTGPGGGSGTPDAYYEGASQDGLRTFFSTTDTGRSIQTFGRNSSVVEAIGNRRIRLL